ncbi:MAG: efflux RND transporter periplasmic adaptor subunit [Rhizobiales bacterium]|nr:efflux RND transporter periplasmic adaptor subunit [Hyphomicrobiales bacterium]
MTALPRLFLAAALAAAALPARAADLALVPLAVPELKAVFGKVESRTVVPARARIGGTLRDIRISEGSEVRQGELIASVVDDKLALELNAADARIKELRSQLDNARTELDRNQQLLARGVVAQSRVDSVKTQFDVAANQVTAAEADKAVIEQRVREGAILAPASGRVLTVPVTLGSVILAGEEIARVASGGYFLRLSLPERHAADIQEGSTVEIGQRGLAPGEPDAARTGRVAKVYPEIADGRVIADVEMADIGDYFVNERILVRIPVGERRVLAVPPQAISTRHGIDYVRLAAPGGTREVAVIPGERIATAQGPRVEILTGLRAGDTILLPEPRGQ